MGRLEEAKLVAGSTIKCRLCGVEFQKITNTHLEKAHPDWTLDRYREEFGEESLMSDDWRWLIAQVSQREADTIVTKGSATKRKRMSEVAAEFTEEEFQVVLGGLLGDAWLFQPKKVKYPPRGTGSTYFSMQHKFTQLSYMAWKARRLSRFRPTLYQRFGYNTVKRRFDVKHQVDTMWHYLFGDLAQTFYPRPEYKKILPLDLLEKLEPLGLAIWYQDDGCLSPSYLEISTHAFSRESVESAIQILTSRFGVDFRAHSYSGQGNPYALITVPRSKCNPFFELVRPFIHPCMLYKIGGGDSVVAEVTKRLKLVYGHYLVDYNGACEVQHGHNATVEISVKGPINPDTGMVMDFGEIKKIAQALLDVWDHDVLNEVDPSFAIAPTAEVLTTYLAATLREYIPGLSRIQFYETDSSSVILDVRRHEGVLDSFLQRMAESGEWWQELKSKSIKSSLWPDPH